MVYNALAQMAEQQRIQTEKTNELIQIILTQNAERGRCGNENGKSWDTLDRYRDLKTFDGSQREFEEWSVKLRSLIRAGSVRTGELLSAIETECSEEGLMKDKDQYAELFPKIDETEEWIAETSAKLYNLLLNKTTGEANAVIRRTTTDGILGWKRLVSNLNPRTLASGIKAISGVLNPPKVMQASKADHIMDEWETKVGKLSTEYGQHLTSKIKVAVLYGMMPKDMQERVSDACAVSWDQTSEVDAGSLYEKSERPS